MNKNDNQDFTSIEELEVFNPSQFLLEIRKTEAGQKVKKELTGFYKPNN